MFRNALLACALGLSAYAVGEADTRTRDGQPTGWYVAGEVGAAWIEDADGTVNFGGPTIPFDAEFEAGPAVLVDVGYRWESNWRLEFEAGYRINDIDCVSLAGGPCSGVGGDVSQFTQMINVLYDIPLDDRLTLSLGAGVGGDLVTVDTPLFEDSDYVVAGQLIAALNYAITDGIDLSLTYRFLLADDPHLSGGPIADANFDDAKHTVTIGLRFALDPDDDSDEPAYTPQPRTEAPVRPPLPEPAPVKRFIVFFGFNKTNLTLKALAIVAEAAETANHGSSASILVTGHTDTVGSAGYNQLLSERRARVVKRELVRLGVPPRAITTIGKGEKLLLVRTPDRTWEDRNRRATIDVD